jgi:hypothetical protein
MSENYLGIMMRILSPHNYGYRILSPSIYDDAEKLRFIGILTYPKILKFNSTCTTNLRKYKAIKLKKQGEKLSNRTLVKVLKCYHSKKVLNRSELK